MAYTKALGEANWADVGMELIAFAREDTYLFLVILVPTILIVYLLGPKKYATLKKDINGWIDRIKSNRAEDSQSDTVGEDNDG